MSRSWITVTVIFALWAICYEASSHELRKFSIEKILSPVSLPSKYVSVGKLVTEDNDSVYYAVCHQLEDTHDHVCNLTKLTHAFSNIVYEDVCVDIKLPVTDANFAFKLAPVAEDVVVFAGFLTIKPESGKRNVTLNFVNVSSCTLNNLSLDPYPTYLEMVVYHDFFKFTSPCNDISLEYCRRSYNFKGEPIEDALPWARATSYGNMVFAVDPASVIEGHYELALKIDSGVIRHVDTDGQRTDITKIEELNNDREDIIVSNSRGLFAVCWLEKSSTIRCLQSDTKILHLNKSLTLSETKSDDYTWFAVRNLALGEILVAAGSCESTDGQYHCYEFRVWFVNKDGQKRTAMLFQEVNLRCSSGEVQAKISESKDEFCFILRCLRQDKLLKEERWVLQGRTWCVPKESVLIPSRRTNFLI